MIPWRQRVRARAWAVAWLARILKTYLRRDTRRPSPVPENPRFMSARAAAGLVGDGDVVAVSGLGGNQRASIMFWAIREAFEETGHPAGLTLMNLGGHGGRGRGFGTLEELGRRGLCARLVTGHFETYRAMLELAAGGACELQCIPQGTLARLIDGLGRGEDSLLSDVGVDTFIDPRVGPGSRVGGTGAQLVSVEGDRLRYRIPPIDVGIFNAPAADRKGNIYVKHGAMIGETAEIARAAKRNGGSVIANVGLVVDEGYDRVLLPADMVDAIVHDPDTEQTAGIPHVSHWPALTTDGGVPIGDALERVRAVNRLAGISRARTPIDGAVARLAASTIVAQVGPGAHVNIGTGLPEHVAETLFEAGVHEQVTLLVEGGPVGGLPAPGIFFGAAFSPKRILSSAEVFALCAERLDCTCLGALEVDGAGNVNVSRRSDGVRDYVGPGGFIDLTAAARTIVFVCGWMVGGRMRVEEGTVRVVRRGTPKFVERVREITFSGARALAAGKRVFYATPVGLFCLTEHGMEVASLMPGIDVRRDVVEVASMRVVIRDPESIPKVDGSIVSGQGFRPRVAS
jgi:propionate CoA-transferase